MKRLFLLTALVCGLVLSVGGQKSSDQLEPAHSPTAAVSAAATTNTYALTGWSELGMHCIDGKDYSVFSVLPPFNVVRAQLVQKSEPPVLITTGVTVTYQATADATGSINTSSASKTNFWDNVRALFLNSVAPDTGLAGYKTQSTVPQPMTYNTLEGYWEAVGIPTVPYDDKGVTNPFPMVKLVATDAKGNVLATASIALSISDELSCNTCHASNSDVNAKPTAGWVNNSDLAKDTKLNILRKHDDRWPIAQYLSQLQTNGYTYQSSLYNTAVAGTPILCAACHSDNALSAPGITGIKALTTDMHTLHGGQLLLSNNKTLDVNSSSNDLNSCYLCHPGPKTKCKRGAMNTQLCSACHGNLTNVGVATRTGWLDEPTCQMCHNNSLRYTSAFTSKGQYRQTKDLTFASNANVPQTGKMLYRYSAGHGAVFCSGCHGSPHSEFPSLQANDNVLPIALQGYAAKITECTACHSSLGVSSTGGPHGVHTLGQAWVDQGGHRSYVDSYGYQGCAYCHGSKYNGSALSLSKIARTFTVEDGQQKTFAANHQFTCYDCHNGPNGG